MPVSAHAPAGAAAPPCRHAQRTARAQASSCTAQLRRGVAACPLAGPRLRDRRRGAWRSAGASVVRVFALDAALPFDYEAQARKRLDAQRSAADKLVIGIVGFGNFGQFLAKRFVRQGHKVIATSRTDYRREAEDLGVTYFSDADDFVEEQPDAVLLCTSILSLESVLRSFPVERLRRSTLVADVLSVKVFPKNLFLATLPPSLDIVCLHPMFGPESGKGSWNNLPLVFDRVRVGDDPVRQQRCSSLLRAFETEGCRMVEMTCEEHDKMAASSQFITHTVGRMLGRMALADTPINTKGYESLLSLVGNTNKDSFDLYYGLFMYNENATEELARMEAAFDAVKRQLFDQLHDVVRTKIFYSPAAGQEQLPVPPQNGASNGSATQAGEVSRPGGGR